MQSILEKLIITIDGPSGSGKSTTAKKLAKRLKLKYLDTGAMYRAVTYLVLKEGIDPENGEEVSRVASDINLSLVDCSGETVLHMNSKSIESKIRSVEVSKAVSPVSRHPGVRREMVKLQRKLGRKGGIVVEGRDTGTTVFPFAQLKVFLIADLDTRVRRRYLQLKSMNIDQNMDKIKENLSYRDRLDSARELSPLVRPPGSVLVDTTGLSINEQVDKIKDCAEGVVKYLDDLKIKEGKGGQFTRMRFYYRISKFIVFSIFKYIFGLRVTGLNNLNYRENFLFACNHISSFDPPVVGSVFNREVNFIAKKELFRNLIFGWLIRKYHAIPVDREDISRKTLRLLTGKLVSGESVLMFPEGTRSKGGKLGKMKPGLGFLVIRTGITVIPVYVRGTDKLLSCSIRRERLEVRIGPPIRLPSDYSPDNKRKDYETLSRMVDDEIRMLRDESKA